MFRFSLTALFIYGLAYCAVSMFTIWCDDSFSRGKMKCWLISRVRLPERQHRSTDAWSCYPDVTQFNIDMRYSCSCLSLCLPCTHQCLLEWCAHTFLSTPSRILNRWRRSVGFSGRGGGEGVFMIPVCVCSCWKQQPFVAITHTDWHDNINSFTWF